MQADGQTGRQAGSQATRHAAGQTYSLPGRRTCLRFAGQALLDKPDPTAIRAGTKQGQIIAMLQRPEGATVAEMVEASGWLAHTVRGSISGALKKTLGLPIAAEKVEGRGTVYRTI